MIVATNKYKIDINNFNIKLVIQQDILIILD